jgi:hypothetical protein
MEYIVITYNFTKKNIRKDYSGQRFSSLTVLSYLGHHNKKDSFWLCSCNCGKQKPIRLRCLKSGQNKTCGECPKPKGSNHYAWKGHGDIPHDLFTTYKHSAAAKKLPFEVTIEYLWELFLSQNKRCALTGWELTFPTSYKTKTNRTASPDRIHSTKGYVKGNVQWVHRDVNKLKKNIPNERFIELCLAIASNQAYQSTTP